ncbi:amino acid permease [Saccharopolyspora mangrovi]|uniref:Amino acid permease n=1 Tax=Saccharopolyspora mangrovi TaxID=3082379 RepID=A0ABU6AEF9_9PSEU|nr:amino acid permease [Saccharopolyspora sp. S2-29]MEB3369705.1 amino acid permease [Saccharopolyspora sp. S2-29]
MEHPLGAQLLRRKPIADIVTDSGQGEGGALRRTLGLRQLTMLSVGATLGTGIFVVLGEAVPVAGPAVVLAFVLAGVTALLSALSYAELAGMIPVAGSSYSYAYATLGELVAWVCGWCLLLEYGVSVAAVAVGWGEYVNELLNLTLGVALPDALSQPPGDGGLVNLPAAAVVILAMVALLGGAKESARANTIMVVIKVATLVLFCVLAFAAVQDRNFSPFLPLGLGGVSAAAAKVFFSYIGFDAASTAGAEARDPQRDLPRAIMLSLGIVTVLYCLVALAAVGAMHWSAFEGAEAALSKVLGGTAGSVLLSFGAVVAVASVVLAVLYGQTRILFSMSRDGLVPKVFSRVNPRTGVPSANTVLVSSFIAVLAAVVPLGALADATSIGTLFAFGLVNIAVLVLRRTQPDLPRTFRAPLAPITPILGVVTCGWMMLSLDSATWVAFGAWMAAGLVVYFGYSRRHSALSCAGPAYLDNDSSIGR